MRRVRGLVGWVALLSGAGSAAAPAPAMTQGEAQADQLAGLRTAWAQALEHQDLEASVALFEPDALFLSPDGGRFGDRAAIRTLYKSVFATYRARIALNSKRQLCSGVLCVDEGSFTEALTVAATGKQLTSVGEYTLVARRQADRSWKIVEMVWTGTTPAPPAHGSGF